MEYPLNMTKAAKPLEATSSAGFAVANDAGEHQKLSDAGYEPKLVGEPDAIDPEDMTKAQLTEALTAKGVTVDARWAKAKLIEELAKV